MGDYNQHDRERWVSEPPKRPERTAFERDRARVLHSAALRRLGGKTQVVDPGGDSLHSPRTRLTHSLECAQVGRGLARALGSDPDLVETACLAHDLGHPPFGHNGETALDTVARRCGGFEGNAQSLRILTRLEAKTPGAGLNLTRASLDAAMKYPWAADGSAKYGFYDDDREAAAWVRKDAADGALCFEAQIMDWADDVAYSVHDVEDALQSGFLRLEQLRDPAERRLVCAAAARLYCDASIDELVPHFDLLLAEPFWPTFYDGTHRSLIAVERLTSELIGRFCRAAESATRQAYGPGPLARYGAGLVVPHAQRLECALLKGIAAHYVMLLDSRTQDQATQRELLLELSDAIAREAPRSLDPAFRDAYRQASSEADALRVVVDQVASLTDASAISWYDRLHR